MITHAQKKKMKKVLKARYAKAVQERLNEKGIVTKKGTAFGVSYIAHVFNGRNENLQIEEAIIEIYQERLLEMKNISNRRKEILNA